MPSCDLCGKDGPLFHMLTEGTEFDVCKGCAKFGKVVARPRPVSVPSMAKPIPKLPTHEVLEIIVEDYGMRIKQKREKLGLTQEDLARKLAEKASVLQKIESGHQEPSIALAQKIALALGITLIVQHEETHMAAVRTSGNTFTIGDILSRKR